MHSFIYILAPLIPSFWYSPYPFDSSLLYLTIPLSNPFPVVYGIPMLKDFSVVCLNKCWGERILVPFLISLVKMFPSAIVFSYWWWSEMNIWTQGVPWRASYSWTVSCGDTVWLHKCPFRRSQIQIQTVLCPTMEPPPPHPPQSALPYISAVWLATSQRPI